MRTPMARAGWLWIVVCVLSPACGGDHISSIRNLEAAGDAIICFGDSLTEGVGAGSGEDYPSVLSRWIGAPVINAGHRGDTTAQALVRLQPDVLEKHPRIVIILLGGNDFLRQLPLSETRKNLEEIVRRIQTSGSMVVIAGLKLGLFTDDYGPLFAETAERAGALLVPQVMKGILTDANLKSDAIHPNAAGYQLMAERIAEKLKPLVAEADRRRGRSGAG